MNVLYAIEILTSLVVTLLFNPQKLHVAIKCLIVGVLSFFVAYVCYHELETRFEFVAVLICYAFFCYLLSLFISIRYGRAKTEKIFILIAICFGIGAFMFYVNNYYKPVASVTDYYMQMNQAAEGQMTGGGSNNDGYHVQASPAAILNEDQPSALKEERKFTKRRRRDSTNRRPNSEEEKEEL